MRDQAVLNVCRGGGMCVVPQVGCVCLWGQVWHILPYVDAKRHLHALHTREHRRAQPGKDRTAVSSIDVAPEWDRLEVLAVMLSLTRAMMSCRPAPLLSIQPHNHLTCRVLWEGLVMTWIAGLFLTCTAARTTRLLLDTL